MTRTPVSSPRMPRYRRNAGLSVAWHLTPNAQNPACETTPEAGVFGFEFGSFAVRRSVSLLHAHLVGATAASLSPAVSARAAMSSRKRATMGVGMTSAAMLSASWRGSERQSDDSAVLHGGAAAVPGVDRGVELHGEQPRGAVRVVGELDAGDDAGGDAEVIPALGEADHRDVRLEDRRTGPSGRRRAAGDAQAARGRPRPTPRDRTRGRWRARAPGASRELPCRRTCTNVWSATTCALVSTPTPPGTDGTETTTPLPLLSRWGLFCQGMK